MHELSIATSLVELACAEASRLGAARVDALHLRVGPLAGIVPDALRFSFDLATADTPIAGARLVIVDVPIVAFCERCDAEREIRSPQQLACPACGAMTPDIRQGADLELFAMEIGDDEAAHR